jgi:SAM-dependent methyltransferase
MSGSILVAIAYHGTTNEPYVHKLIDSYRSMSFAVDIVLLTEAPKDLHGVEQRIGLPIEDPYSLPWAHKDLFAERRDDYDLFIYSEDDTLVREADVCSFLRATALLPPDHVAGFLRTEIHADGTLRCSSAHNNFHWDPSSALEAGGEVFAHFTNPHSALFMLTRDQLQRAIDSGGFLRSPRSGRFSMRVTAATDPYTRCGLHKVVSVSRLEDFLLPHLSNRYQESLGIPVDELRRQADAVRATVTGEVRTDRLFAPGTSLDDHRWDKRFYEPPDLSALDAIPPSARSVLSLGVGAGWAEQVLIERGHEVTGIPLDAVIAVSAASRGVEVTVPNLTEALAALGDRRFDAVFVSNSLQYFADPVDVLSRLMAFALPGALVVASMRNVRPDRLRARVKDGVVPVPTATFEEIGVHLVEPATVGQWFRRAGLGQVEVAFTDAHRLGPVASFRAPRAVVTGLARRAPAARSAAGPCAARVSIGIPVHNGEQYLPECLASVQSQDYDDIEVVISDNASTDGTEELCRALAAADPRVRYHRQDRNMGAAYNYNTCFLLSRGELFAWLAHDDLRAPTFISQCVATIDDCPPSVVLVYPRSEFIDADGRFLRTDRFGVASGSPAPHRRLAAVVTDGGAVNPLFGVARASALEQTRLIGPFRASDRVLLAEVAMLGEIRELPETLMYRRLHERTSTEANPSALDRTRWFDPTARTPRLSRRQRLVLEYSRSALRLPLTPSQRALCLATIPSSMGVQTARNFVGRWRRQLVGGHEASRGA